MKRLFLALVAAIVMAGCTEKKAATGQQGNGTVTSVTADKNVAYEEYFTAERLRIDLILAGNSESQMAYLSGLAKEAAWAGTKDGLIDPFGYGEYYYEAFSDGKLIFSRGFAPLFQEWVSTEQAQRVDMAMTQTVWMPFPKASIHFVLYARDADKYFRTVFECDIDPEDKRIAVTPLVMPEALQQTGNLEDKVDLLFIAEGYTPDQMNKFKADAQRFTDYLFEYEPYRSRKNDFNIWILGTPSQEEGVDIPHFGQWRQTLCQSGFYTFYIDRYLTIQDHTAIADAVASAPFDAVFIIANETKYGGGGFYNSYAMGTCGHELSNEVFIHEFGHSFAGLGDEYYSSDVAISDDYYPNNVEPWEPNITNLVDFESKWKDMVADGTEIPTPNDSAHTGIVGLYEGAAYHAHGMYRPVAECRMFNNTAPAFCPVCQRAIDRMIDFYCK